MAYSIFAFLKPEIVEVHDPYFDQVFADNPWWLEPMKGDKEDGLIWAWIKPRYETNGYKRFLPFFKALKRCKDYVVFISDDDTPERKHLIPLMEEYGFEDLIPLLDNE